VWTESSGLAQLNVYAGRLRLCFFSVSDVLEIGSGWDDRI
jgi:hypothetical protein